MSPTASAPSKCIIAHFAPADPNLSTNKVFQGVASPPMIEQVGFGTCVFFGIMCFLAAIWAHILVPETKGKTLEELDVFGHGSEKEEHEIMRRMAATATMSKERTGPRFV